MNTSSTPSRLTRFVTRESTGGILLLAAAAVALILANSPLQGFYADLSAFRLGPAALHLDLPLSVWAADGLLALFFFVVGVELKHELFAAACGAEEAAVPVVAAVGGMVVPAVMFTLLLVGWGDPEALHGWAIPTATDIAFALAVLAIFGRGLPRALRTFLLTLAVVDDLLAIIVIAAFYTASIHPLSLFAAVAAIAVFGLLVRLRTPRWWLLIPVGVVAWGFMHASGVHATIAGVALGFTVPAFAIHDEQHPRTHQLDKAVRPLSAGFALPVFAFFAAGVTLTGGSEGIFGQPVFLATLIGLVAGKLIGVLGTTALVTRFATLPATGRHRVAGPAANRVPVRHRIHGVTADHRTVVRGRRALPSGEGRHPRGQPARCGAGRRPAALGRPNGPHRRHECGRRSRPGRRRDRGRRRQ